MGLEWLARYCDQTCDSVNCTSETRSGATLATVKQFSFTCLIVYVVCIAVSYQRSVVINLFIEYCSYMSVTCQTFGFTKLTHDLLSKSPLEKISYWNHHSEFRIINLSLKSTSPQVQRADVLSCYHLLTPERVLRVGSTLYVICFVIMT